MASAKDLIVKPITAQDANRIIRALHYSGKVVNNSQVHLGVFLDEKCGGAMQFGPSFDKRKIQGLVNGTVHILPVGDCYEHSTDPDAPCGCCPRIEKYHRRLVIHNSADRREEFEGKPAVVKAQTDHGATA